MHHTIITDVVKTKCVRKATDLPLIQGPWAEIAVGCCLLCSTTVDNKAELSTLKTNAPQLYNSIAFYRVPDQFCNILELLDTRFAEVYWYEEPDCRRSESALIQVSKFMKRQLKSKYLRWIAISGETRTEDLNELLVEFVKRPQFEYLLNETADPLPFEVIEEAHRAWETTEHFAVDRKWIEGTISAETLKKIEEKFKPFSSTTNDVPDFLVWKHNHPRYSAAEIYMNVSLKNRSGQFVIKLQFSKFNEDFVFS